MRSTLPPDAVSQPALQVEPVIGWRAWSLRRDVATGGLVLGSIAKPGSWPPMRALHGTCRKGAEHRTPDPGCTCGIYAVGTAARLRLLTRGVPNGAGCIVVGSVAMWGRVIEHTSGYRAEFAYPDRIRLACSGCLRTGSMSKADVVLAGAHPSGGELRLALCGEHARDLARCGATPAKQVQVELLSTYAVDLLVDPEPPRVRPGGVLVADHHPLVRPALVRYLAHEGFRVVGAAQDGLEAIELAERLRPEVVTTCIRMPVLDGLTAAGLIRERFPEMQVVILTAYPDEVFRQTAKEIGAVGYVLKTSPCEEIVLVVQSALTIARARPRKG